MADKAPTDKMPAAEEYGKPLPAISSLNRPFWDGLREGELRMQQCAACHKMWYPPSPFCPDCWGGEVIWTVVSGRATVNSWVRFHQAYWPAYADELPYNVAEVTLEEGPRLLTNLVGIAEEDIRIGLEVQVVFDPVTDDVTLAKFGLRR